MPTPPKPQSNTKKFFGWLRRTLDVLCDRPDHLQRVSIIASGFVMWPTMIGFALIVWLGYGPEHGAQSLNYMGFALVGSMLLWGLVIIALLGIVKGVRVAGPGGMSVSIQTTADDPDVDPTTTRNASLIGNGPEESTGGYGDGGYGEGGGFGGGRDRRGGRPMPQVNITQVAGSVAAALKPDEGEVSD